MDHMDHCPRAQIWRGATGSGGVALKEWFIVIAADPSSFKACRKMARRCSKAGNLKLCA